MENHNKNRNIINFLRSRIDLSIQYEIDMTNQVFDLQNTLKLFDEYDSMIELYIKKMLENPNFLNIRQSEYDLSQVNLSNRQKIYYSLLEDMEAFQCEMLERFALEKAVQLVSKFDEHLKGNNDSSLPVELHKELNNLVLIHDELCNRASFPMKRNRYYMKLNEFAKQDTCLIYTNYLKNFDIVYQYIYSYVVHSYISIDDLNIDEEQLLNSVKNVSDIIRKTEKEHFEPFNIIRSNQIYAFLKLLFEFHLMCHNRYPKTYDFLAPIYDITTKYFVDNDLVDSLRYKVEQNTTISAQKDSNFVQYLQIIFRQNLIRRINSDDELETFFLYLFESFDNVYEFVNNEKSLEVNVSKVFKHYLSYQLKNDFEFFKRSQHSRDYSFIEIVESFTLAHARFIGDIEPDENCLTFNNIFLLDEMTDSFRYLNFLTKETQNMTDSDLDSLMNDLIDRNRLSDVCKAWYLHYKDEVFNDLFYEPKKPL